MEYDARMPQGATLKIRCTDTIDEDVVMKLSLLEMDVSEPTYKCSMQQCAYRLVPKLFTAVLTSAEEQASLLSASISCRSSSSYSRATAGQARNSWDSCNTNAVASLAFLLPT